ncbi:MAG: membrane dipeptidase [Bryobacterales bacterium]|nr:membrane dipeptidase [Bryobacterales bacterium]
MRLILDAHLDLAWNAMSFDRDQTLPVTTLRAREERMTGRGRGNCTTSLVEMRKAGVGLCLGTLLARTLPAAALQSFYAETTVAKRAHGPVIHREDLDYANQTITCAAAQGQMAYYRMLEFDGEVQIVRTAQDLTGLAARWKEWLHADAANRGAPPPIGIVVSMEGADPIRSPGEAAKWFENGLRTACLAHYGPSAYAMGTGGDGPLTADGVALVKEFDRLGIVLDLVHTADTAIEQALGHYTRPVFVSHGNCRALVPHDRQMSDAQIRAVAARDGVVGVVLDSWMIVKDYVRGCAREQNPTFEDLAAHVDHLCQITGSCRHVGIGSDLDGGFGTEQTPRDIETIADLQKLGEVLRNRGYADTDIDGIFHENFLRFFAANLPQASAPEASA